MRYVALVALAVLAVTCGPSPNAKLPAWATNSGGAGPAGSGGKTGTGGTTTDGSGGTTVTGSGGRTTGSGGVSSRGGSDTGGQITGSGGRTTAPDASPDLRPPRDTATATGGTTPGGTGGTTIVGTGGVTGRDAGAGGGAGRDAGTGGAAGRDAGAGGVTGRGGVSGTGGVGGTGGSTVSRDANTTPSDVASSCFSTIVSNGYACGSTPACSACKVNGESKETECKKGIDCLAAAGPSCDSNCQLNCLNSAGDAQVGACIKALQTAACGGTGC